MSVLNDKVVPRALRWAKDSGATFESDKTVLMHFTRNRKKITDADPPLRVGSHVVLPSTKERILGVIFDSELRFKDHLAKVKTRGWRSAGQLKRLAHVGPQSARQLYQATVASRTDYAAVTWYSQFIGSKVNNTVAKILNPIQRIGSQAVVKCFRTTSVEAASAEATLHLPHVRLQLKIGKLWVGLHTLPETNPLNAQLRKVLDKPKSKSFTSPLRHLKTHLGRPGAKIETIPAWVAPPWGSPAVNDNNPDQTSFESATARYAKSRDQHLNLFADGSVTHSKAGIGITVYLKKATPLTTYSRLIKQNGEIDSTVVELVAVREAVTLAGTLLEIINRRGTPVPQVSIWSDSQTAIRMVTRQEIGSGATIVHKHSSSQG